MLQNIIEADSVNRILDQKLCNKVFAIVRNLFPTWKIILKFVLKSHLDGFLDFAHVRVEVYSETVVEGNAGQTVEDVAQVFTDQFWV